jgi:N-acetylglucosaminyldiphosphoundecaprenol N-acetyl-beta-D-mannosaminyltransferase
MSHLSNCHHNNAPERVNILGVGISAITPEGAVRQMSAWIEAKDYKYINVCTVHTVMECQRNPNLRDIVNRSGLATPDGMPLVWFCRCHGKKNVTRVYGPDLMLSFCEFSAIKGYRHFFYGGQPGVAQLLVNVLKKNYPRLQVAGAYSPPFRPTGTLEEPEVIKEINDARPDVVWVGLGTPKQDFWVSQHRPFLDAPVLVAVGAAFDFHTGRVPQAPSWMQRSGLEWLFRLLQEPRRLAFRYLVYNPLFIMHILLQITNLRTYSIK